MTLADVQAAKAALEQEGQTPTCNAVLHRLGYGSKRDVVHFMRQLQPEERVEEEDQTTNCDIVTIGGADSEETPAPLPLARQRRDATRQAEHHLALAEQRLKQQRRTLENEQTQLTIQAQTVRSDVQDLTCRRQAQTVARQLVQVEDARRQVHLQRREAWQAALTAQDAYAVLQGQAARWLRRLKQAQRVAQTSTGAFHRGEARQELAEAFAQLAGILGQTEAEELAADPSLHPDWLKD